MIKTNNISIATFSFLPNLKSIPRRNQNFLAFDIPSTFDKRGTKKNNTAATSQISILMDQN